MIHLDSFNRLFRQLYSLGDTSSYRGPFYTKTEGVYVRRLVRVSGRGCVIKRVHIIVLKVDTEMGIGGSKESKVMCYVCDASHPLHTPSRDSFKL